jgi:hypothetical protein
MMAKYLERAEERLFEAMFKAIDERQATEAEHYARTLKELGIV